MDVFEIDAASHTSVDNIRDLIENARYAPSSARFKTFIIDEVHMLSRSAFNALLKTLEEPPEHVIFIMATTELAKVPVTVLSRCQRYDFRRIPVDEIISHLKSVAHREGIRITDDALVTIALHADGSMRDAQGMLEHVAAAAVDCIANVTVESMLGLVGSTTMHDMLSGIAVKDVTAVLDVIAKAYEHGHDMSQLYRSLMESCRNMMVLKAGYQNLALPQEEKAFLQEISSDMAFEELHRIMSVLISSEDSIKFSGLPRITFETVLLRIISAPSLVDLRRLIQSPAGRQAGSAARQPVQPLYPVTEEKTRKPLSALPHSWEGFITYLKDHDQPLYAMLVNTGLTKEGDEGVTISCTSSFIADQLKKALPEIQKKAHAFFMKDMSICIETSEANDIAKKPKPSEIRANAMKSPVVKEILSEFNGVVRDVRPNE